MGIAPTVDFLKIKPYATTAMTNIRYSSDTLSWEPDFSNCKTCQDRLNRIAQCMEARNSLDFCAYRLGESLATQHKKVKVTAESQGRDLLEETVVLSDEDVSND